jgi:hypothetical protein
MSASIRFELDSTEVSDIYSHHKANPPARGVAVVLPLQRVDTQISGDSAPSRSAITGFPRSPRDARFVGWGMTHDLVGHFAQTGNRCMIKVSETSA